MKKFPFSEDICQEYLTDSNHLVCMSVCQGYQLLKTGQYQEARHAFDKALTADSDNIDLLFARAECCRQLKIFDQAESDLCHILHLNPDHIESYRLRAIVHNKQNDYVRASDDLTEVIERVPDDFEAYHIRGITYAKLGDYYVAVDDITQAIRIDPSSATAYRSRGLAYGHLKKYAMALSDFNRALELDPDEPYPAIRDRGCIQVHLHAFQAAIDDLTKAIQIEPSDVEAYRNRALAYYCLRQYQNCIDDSMTALRHNSHDSQACLDIAKANFKLNRLSDAVSYLIDAVVIDSSHANAVKKLLQKLLVSAQIEQKRPIPDDSHRKQSLSTTVPFPPMPEPPENSRISRNGNQSSNFSDKEAHDSDESGDDAAARKRKAMLKHLLATKRLAEFRRQGQEKSELKKKVEERQALTAKEVERRAEQAIKLKREIELQFSRSQKEKEEINEDVDKEIDSWMKSLRIRPDADNFQTLVMNLPKLLNSHMFSELGPVCASFTNNFSRHKAYRELARLIHPDKLKSDTSARDACLATAAWCAISNAYSQNSAT